MNLKYQTTQTVNVLQKKKKNNNLKEKAVLPNHQIHLGGNDNIYKNLEVERHGHQILQNH